jgi:hypothetical protein
MLWYVLWCGVVLVGIPTVGSGLLQGAGQQEEMGSAGTGMAIVRADVVPLLSLPSWLAGCL